MEKKNEVLRHSFTKPKLHVSVLCLENIIPDEVLNCALYGKYSIVSTFDVHHPLLLNIHYSDNQHTF